MKMSVQNLKGVRGNEYKRIRSTKRFGKRRMKVIEGAV